MTESEIRFNYEKSMKQAEELKQIAQSLSKVSTNQLSECLGKIEKNWSGDNSDAYRKKGVKLQGKIETSAKGVKLAAESIETMARNIYRAEMAALEATRRRKHR